MDSVNQVVNLCSLDKLAIEYAREEGLLDPAAGAQAEPTAGRSTANRGLVEQVRQLMLLGRVQEAVQLVDSCAQGVLKDDHLMFRLLKQDFVETLRAGGEGAYERALQCCQERLVPFAAGAYPEAYTEVKHIMLALLFDKDDSSSPVAPEWSEDVREDLAGLLACSVRLSLQAYDPQLSLLLRYLISINNRYHLRQGTPSPLEDVASAVLLGKRDPQPAPDVNVPPLFDESRIQNLAHAVDLSRQAAVDSLRNTSGDVNRALKNELSRIRADMAVLDDLVREYLEYRGLINTLSSFQSQPPANGLSSPSCFKANGHIAANGSNPSPDQGCSANAVLHDGHFAREDSNACASTNGENIAQDTEMRSAEEPHEIELPSTSTAQSEGGIEEIAARKREARRKAIEGLPRWRGRPEGFRDPFQTTPAQPPPSSANLPSEPTGQAHEEHMSNGGAEPMDTSEQGLCEAEDVKERYQRALEIREMMSEGLAEEVVKEVQQLDSKFFERNPELLFQLRQLEFLRLVEAGEYSKALAVARSDLGPLAAAHPSLLQPLKGTLLALAKPSAQLPVQPPPPTVLAGALQVALGASLGMSEPRLVKLMRGVLHAHTEWFKLQVCEDPFRSELSIDALKQVEDMRATANGSHATENGGPASGAPRDSVANGGEDVLFNETSILTLMEFMALSRGDAIQLLGQYEGSVETVFAHLLA